MARIKNCKVCFKGCHPGASGMCVECFKATRTDKKTAMSTDDAINYAAGNLPYGWLLSIEVEEGYACLVLFDDTGEKREVWDFEKCTPLYERIEQLVERARQMAAPDPENFCQECGVDMPLAGPDTYYICDQCRDNPPDVG